MNKKVILKNLKKVPFVELLDDNHIDDIGANDQNLFLESYYFFILIAERLLDEMNSGKLYERECLNRGIGFNDRQKIIAKNFNKNKRFIELDWINLIIIIKILFDRYTKFIHPHLKKINTNPSPNSFNKHRKYFLELKESSEIIVHYKNLLKNRISWYPLLKYVRDNLVVHSYKKNRYLKFIGANGRNRFSNCYVFILSNNDSDYQETFPPILNLYEIIDDIVTFFKEINKLLNIKIESDLSRKSNIL